MPEPLKQHWDHVITYELWRVEGKRSLFKTCADDEAQNTFDIRTERREGWGYNT